MSPIIGDFVFRRAAFILRDNERIEYVYFERQ